MSRGKKQEVVRWSILVALCLVCSLVICENAAQARPSFGASCSSCHGNVQDGLMQVTDEDKIVDLGTQLDGKTRGPLKTFEAAPGDTVTLSMEVLDGSPNYSVQLKRLETGGQQNDQANKLVWTEANDPTNVWSEWGDPPYFTKDENNDGIVWEGATVGFTFDLLIDPSTPVDLYDLEYAIATGAFGYQDEHFYLSVVPEPTSIALMSLGLIGIGFVGRRRRNSGQ